MSASQTPHYGLNQWSPEDQFLRVEFNADNARTDAALAALASSVGEKAAQADLSALAAVVEGKAAQSSLDSLTATVNKKANQSDLTSLAATVNTKAAQSALDSLTATVNKKANQSDLTSLAATVNTKAAQASLNSLTQTVNTKAAQSALNSLTATVNGKGNCRIAVGSYTGTGTFGSSSPNSLSFPFVPLLVVIHGGYFSTVMTAGCTQAAAFLGRSYSRWTTTWSGTALSWYVTHNGSIAGPSYDLDAESQFNLSGTVYRYVILGAASQA